jgi:hypothetical protein
MMSIKIRRLAEPTLNEPFLVCGLPDAGFIAKQVVDYLIEKLDAKLFEEIYSSYFPSYVLIKKDGIAELMKNELYFWKNTKQKNDLILLTGNTQPLSPEGQYELAEEILVKAETFGVKKIFTISSYFVDRRSTGKPKVYGVVTNPNLKEEIVEYGVYPLSKGSVKGFNGLVFGMAKLKNINGICLLGETIEYTTPSGRTVVDVKSAQSVLEVLLKMLGVEVDLSEIEKQAKTTEEFLRRIEEVERQALEEISRAFAPKKHTYYYI